MVLRNWSSVGLGRGLAKKAKKFGPDCDLVGNHWKTPDEDSLEGILSESPKAKISKPRASPHTLSGPNA